LARAEEQRLTGTHGRAHRFLADARPVVAHVALHHDLAVLVELGHAEGTRHDAIPARDTARLARGLHHTIRRPLDRVCRTDLRAPPLLAVHSPDGTVLLAVNAHDGNGLHALGPIDVLEMNHRFTSVRVALRARLQACLTADASVG